MNNYFEYIEDYLDGFLLDDELINFETELKGNKELQESVENQKKIRSALKQIRLRNKVKGNFEDVKKLGKPSRFSFFRIAAVFIGLIAVTGLGLWLVNNNLNKDVLVDTIPAKKDSVEIVKPLDKILDSQISEDPKFEKYNYIADNSNSENLNFPESATRGLKSTKKSKNQLLADEFFKAPPTYKFYYHQDTVSLLKGIKFFENKKFEDASGSFLSIDENSPMFEDAQWYLALSLLARERYDTLFPLLEDIASQINNPHREKAIQLLEKLNTN
jgi:hypothetical protein